MGDRPVGLKEGGWSCGWADSDAGVLELLTLGGADATSEAGVDVFRGKLLYNVLL